MDLRVSRLFNAHGHFSRRKCAWRSRWWAPLSGHWWTSAPGRKQSPG